MATDFSNGGKIWAWRKEKYAVIALVVGVEAHIGMEFAQGFSKAA